MICRSNFFFLFVVFLFVLLFLAVPAYAATTDETNSLLDSAFEWVKSVFVPSEDYFPNQMQKLNSLIGEKLGGIGQLYKTIEHFFKSLSTENSSAPLMFSVPDNYFFKGFKGFEVDILSQGSVYIKFLRDIASAFICIATAIVCYKRLVTLFSK